MSLTINPIEYLDKLIEAGEDIYEVSVAIGLDDEADMTIRRWRQGDVCTRLQSRYGENIIGKYATAINAASSTLRQRKSMAAFFPPETRAIGDNLGYTHYRHSMKLGSLDKALYALEKASAKDWPVWKFEMIVSRLIGKKQTHESAEGKVTRRYSQDDGQYVVIKVDMELAVGQTVTIRAK